jgi:carbamoyl-phosphate synthase small subunit
MRGAVVAGEAEPEEMLARIRATPAMTGLALVADVSATERTTIGSGDVHVGLLDYGTKRSIVSRLVAAGATVTVFPHATPAAEVLDAGVDGVLLSNGPGDPAALPAEVAEVERLVGRTPILGICLGHQLLGLATGYRTAKLPFGHRGANHPVLDRATGRVLVTAQNHGFAVEGEGSEVSHVSLYDGTVEGLALPAERARSVQFHPEAGPGPHDAWQIVESFVEEVRAHARAA